MAQKSHRKAKMIVVVECGKRRRLELEESKSQSLISTPKRPGTSRICNDQTSFPSFRFSGFGAVFVPSLSVRRGAKVEHESKVAAANERIDCSIKNVPKTLSFLRVQMQTLLL
jgi:hypothetical protein